MTKQRLADMTDRDQLAFWFAQNARVGAVETRREGRGTFLRFAAGKVYGLFLMVESKRLWLYLMRLYKHFEHWDRQNAD